MTVCQHCQKREASHPRRLCYKCYSEHNIRCKYAPVGPHGNRTDGAETIEELDAMIAEQYPTMPKRRVGEE